MKRFVSSLVTAALVFSVTASAFALEDPVQNEIYNKPVTQIIHPKYVESLLKEKKWKKLGRRIRKTSPNWKKSIKLCMKK